MAQAIRRTTPLRRRDSPAIRRNARVNDVYRDSARANAEIRRREILVIIGNGMTGFRLCQKIVECGAHAVLDIVVFGEEPLPAYDRIHLTELFSGKTIDDLTFAPREWYEQNGIELRLGDPVVAIDRGEGVVRSASGFEVPYDRLVLATGSRPFVPPIEGVDLPGVFVYRTVEDLAAIMRHGHSLKRAAVIGGGLLGLEAAKAVYDLGLEVHVVEFAPRLMPRQLDQAGADVLRAKIEELGIRVHAGKATTRITAGASSANTRGREERILHFADGGELAVDFVVISAGIRPRGELIAASGIELAKNGAIVIDDRLATSDPRIFAVGECAIHRGITYGLVFPGYKMVDVLVDNLVGGTATFDGADQSAKLKLMGVHVAALGAYDETDVPKGTVHTFGSASAYRKLVMHEGKSRIAGAMAVGEWKNLDRVRDTIEQCRPVSFWDIRRFRSTGNLWLKSKMPPVAEWPAQTLVCSCMRVDRGTLTKAIVDGCASVEQLSARTGAGSMCGSCRPLLGELLGNGAGVDSGATSDHDGASMPSPISLIDAAARCAETDVALAPLPMRVKAKAQGIPAPSMTKALEVVVSEFAKHAEAADRHSETAIGTAEPSCATTRRRERIAQLPLQPIPLAASALLASGRIAPPQRSAGERALRPLLAASLLSLFVVLATAALGWLSSSGAMRSVRFGAFLGESAWRQATGYTMLALGLLSLSLSARKRFKWFAVGDVSLFRAVHGGLGALILIVLILHAGCRLGRNLNEALTIDFLMLAAIGAIAGGVTALSHWWNPVTARNRRRVWNAVHLVLVWPLPVLLILHIVSVYFY
jgi:nitrite reductase (NADH) large subunit